MSTHTQRRCGQVLLFLALLMSFQRGEAKNCVDVNALDVPLCFSPIEKKPATKGKVSLTTPPLAAENYYPAAALTVTDLGGKDFLRSFVLKVLKAQPKNPPLIFVNGSADNIESLKSEIADASRDPATRSRWLGSIREFGGSPAVWQQDMFQSAMNPETGLPVLRETTAAREFANAEWASYLFTKARGYSFDQVAKLAAEECDIKTERPIEATGVRTNAHKGGNIEGTVGSLCLIGSGALGPDQLNSLVKSACGDKEHAIIVRTGFLRTEHVDELITTVRLPDRSPPCDFDFLIASPQAALNALTHLPPEQENSPFLAFHETSPEQIRKHLNNPAFGPRDLCEEVMRWKNRSEPKLPIPSHPARANDSVTRLFPMRELGSLALPWAHARSPESERTACLDLTNGDVSSYLKNSDSQLRRLNLLVKTEMENLKKQIRDKLKTASGGALAKCSEPLKFIEVPTLFSGRMIEGYGREPDRLGSLVSSSLFPNPINGIQIASTFIAPDPGSPILRNTLRDNLRAGGIQLETVNSIALDLQNGNIHCATNTMRYCRPPETSRFDDVR